MMIINLANDIENLTNMYAGYLNIMVRIKDKYGAEFKGLDESDKDALLQATEGMRSYMVRCWANAEKLQSKIPPLKEKITEIRKLYKVSKETSIIPTDTAEKFIVVLGSAFTEGVLADLLVRSRDIYNEVLK